MAQQISAGEGTVTVGQSDETVNISGATISVGGSSAKIGFFGATPSVQAALTLSPAITDGSTITPVAAAFVELVTELVAKGIIGDGT